MLGEVLRIPCLKGKAIPLGLGEVNICTPRPDSPPTIFCAKRMSIPIFYWILLGLIFKAPRLNQQDFDNISYFKFANRAKPALLLGQPLAVQMRMVMRPTVFLLRGYIGLVFSSRCNLRLPPSVSSGSRR